MWHTGKQTTLMITRCYMMPTPWVSLHAWKDLLSCKTYYNVPHLSTFTTPQPHIGVEVVHSGWWGSGLPAACFWIVMPQVCTYGHWSAVKPGDWKNVLKMIARQASPSKRGPESNTDGQSCWLQKGTERRFTMWVNTYGNIRLSVKH